MEYGRISKIDHLRQFDSRGNRIKKPSDDVFLYFSRDCECRCESYDRHALPLPIRIEQDLAKHPQDLCTFLHEK
jgi:hypothetical protein